MTDELEECTEGIALRAYTEAIQNLQRWEAEHIQMIAHWTSLKLKANDAEGDLKSHCRENGPCKNECFTVTVTRKTRKWYDTDYILEHAPFVLTIPGVVVQTVDKTKIEALAKAKAIDAGICAAALREEELTPAVSIKARL